MILHHARVIRAWCCTIDGGKMSLYKLEYLHETERWFIEFSADGTTWNDSGDRPFNLEDARKMKEASIERHPNVKWRVIGTYRRNETRVYE